MSSTHRRWFGAGLLGGVAVGLSIGVIAAEVGNPFDDEEDRVAEAREVIEESYFRVPSEEALERASIEGMIRELRRRYGDRFSHYFDPKDLDEFDAATSGNFSGVGLTVNEVKRGLRVARVIPDTPAERANLEEGDVIVAVDGRSIEGVPSRVSTARIKGPPGTEVELEIVSAADGERREVALERASVRIPAVRGEIRRIDGREVAYLYFATFSEGAHGELRAEIERLYRRGAEATVLDIRGNGGGLLQEAVLSASVFVEDGLIATTDSRVRGAASYDAVGDALEPHPTVLLLNRDTASAAEILAGALAEYDLATLVGTRTFGKGSVQEVIHLEGGGALDLTVGRYLPASGESLEGTGIRPDVRAGDDPATGGDEALRRALEVAGRKAARQGP